MVKKGRNGALRRNAQEAVFQRFFEEWLAVQTLHPDVLISLREQLSNLCGWPVPPPRRTWDLGEALPQSPAPSAPAAPLPVSSSESQAYTMEPDCNNMALCDDLGMAYCILIIRLYKICISFLIF